VRLGLFRVILGSSDLLLQDRLLEFATFRGRWWESPKRDPASAIGGAETQPTSRPRPPLERDELRVGRMVR
jgi:hypothetical protein